MQPHESTSQPRNPTKLLRIVVAITVIGLMAAIAIPNFVRARVSMSMSSCIFNQMWIETAKRHWAAETHQHADGVPTEADLFKYMGQVTPMWATRKLSVRVPAEFPACVTGQRLRVGTASLPIQCDAVSEHRWDEQAYRSHYALDER